MTSTEHDNNHRPYWFVGATYGGDGDQMDRFIEQGIWENGYSDKYLDQVNSVKSGDHIAIKAAYTQKHNLPFEGNGETASVMSIKAIGTVVKNVGDGRRLKVDWEPVKEPRLWYFYTFRLTIHEISQGKWEADALIDFAFNGKSQDYDRFRNAPFWKERFGDMSDSERRFQWAKFYSEFATKLLKYENDRGTLVEAVNHVIDNTDGISVLQDRFSDGSTGSLIDICPFTTMGIFNRGITDDKRVSIASKFSQLLDISIDVPDSFDGIPVLNNQKSWFFGYEKDRGQEDIDLLWTVFRKAIEFADSDDVLETELTHAYDRAATIKGVKWNLTMGFYWIRPWIYPALDDRSRTYINNNLTSLLRIPSFTKLCSAYEYLSLKASLEKHFNDEAFPVHSFPELSYAAWKDGVTKVEENTNSYDSNGDEGFIEPDEPLAKPYTVEDIMSDGCFLEREKVISILDRLKSKKNLILQGPPGTGKTWLAKRLAFALMGQVDNRRLKAVQFHPNLSYEDFVRGWRPSGDGKLVLADGPLMEVISTARQNPSVKYVLVIEEINRGNPAQILGEMLTLLETDKRRASEALELCYSKEANERVYVPENVYVIGTMNIADRSLAMVDLALRRRFAFIGLEPSFNKIWREWVSEKSGIEYDFLLKVKKRIGVLNDDISKDNNLGTQFMIGHSYLTPPVDSKIENSLEWFKQIAKTEIGPLLEEYWFDDLKKAEDAQRQLTAELG